MSLGHNVLKSMPSNSLTCLVEMTVSLQNKMTENLAHGYSSKNTQPELSNEYQLGRDKMVFKNLCILVLWTRSSLAIRRINPLSPGVLIWLDSFDLKLVNE